MTAQEYWDSRIQSRLLQSEARGVQAIADTLKIYDEIQRNILKDIESIYRNYSKKGVLTKTDLEKTLTTQEQSQFLTKVKSKADKLGINTEKVYDERYLSRLNRLRALQEQVRIQIATIAPSEVNLTQQAYKDISNNNYETIQQDYLKVGVTPFFATLDTDVLEQILRNKWTRNENYSSRVWRNVTQLSERLQTVLGAALTGGVAYQKTASLIRKEFNVSNYVAARLIRTESNYFHNQTDLQGYIDNGISKYRYDAVMDGRTSNICKSLNFDVFNVVDAVIGVNFPPAHSNCRSSTSAFFEDAIRNLPTRQERTARFNVGPSNKEIQDNWAGSRGENVA